MAPEAAAEQLDPDEVATLLPGEQPATTIREAAEHPVASGGPATSSSSSQNGNRENVGPYADVRHPDHVAPPALTRSGRYVEFKPSTSRRCFDQVKTQSASGFTEMNQRRLA